jgi:GT2 family glycosyltransferase
MTDLAIGVRNPRISIVVLTFNRCDEVVRTVEYALTLEERPPVIVVDNGSADDTCAVLKQRFPTVEIISLPENIGAAARNFGAHRATTPYVAFCDDDTWWQNGSLARAANLLDRQPRVASVTARVLVGKEEREDPICALMSCSPLPRRRFEGQPILGFLAGATAFRREAFLKAGGYESRFFIGGEETLLALDLAARGWVMLYSSQLTVHHHPSRRRDASGRRALLLRNELWVAWLRRPFSTAFIETRRLLRRAWREGILLSVMFDTLASWPWLFRNRCVVPPRVEALLRRLG